jgi:hypothetical protein
MYAHAPKCKKPRFIMKQGFYYNSSLNKSRQRPTLPHSFPCSTIGSEELNFRVRDGIGCYLFDIATGNFWIASLLAESAFAIPIPGASASMLP